MTPALRFRVKEERNASLSTVFHKYANVLKSLPTSLLGKGGPARHASPQGEAGGEEFPLLKGVRGIFKEL
jgi:hypothetical protein